MISFEPSPSTYSILCENITKNDLKNVIPVNIGLGDKNKKTTISYSPSNRSGGFISNICNPVRGHITEQIEIFRIDDIWGRYSDRVDFIKIDVEGFEGNVIKGATGLLTKYKPIVVLELNHWCLNAFRRTSVPDFFELLRKTFPILYAIDIDMDMKSLHDNDESYHVMYNHIIHNKYPTIVGGFDDAILGRFE